MTNVPKKFTQVWDFAKREYFPEWDKLPFYKFNFDADDVRSFLWEDHYFGNFAVSDEAIAAECDGIDDLYYPDVFDSEADARLDWYLGRAATFVIEEYRNIRRMKEDNND